MEKGGYVYILTNKNRTVLYTGVTSDLINRIDKHKAHFYKNSFTARYNVEHLVYFEKFGCITDAIEREKRVKKWNRSLKIGLIESVNPQWTDLWNEIT